MYEKVKEPYKEIKEDKKNNTKKIKEAIKFFSKRGKPWTTSDIVRRTGIGYNTVRRHFKEIKVS